MPEDSETRYPFMIATKHMDFIYSYLNGFELRENIDYRCLRKTGFVSVQLTLDQAEGLKEDMKDYIIKIALDYDSDDTRLNPLCRK